VRIFLPASSRNAGEAKLLLERYTAQSRHLRFAFVDPQTHPAELINEDVTAGQAIVSGAGRRIVLDDLLEQDLTSAFLRLLRPEGKVVCFTSGHGENDVAEEGPNGLSEMAKALTRAGYQVVTLQPGALAQTPPPSCHVMVVAGPVTGFAPPEADAFQRYLSGEGKAFVMVQPPHYEAAEPLVAGWGVKVDHGVVLDPAQSYQRDPLSPLVDRYPSFNPAVAALRAATVWPETAGLEGGGLVKDHPGVYVSTLAESSETSWVELGGGTGFQKGTDRRGPILVAASSDFSQVEGRERRVSSTRARVARTRLLVFGGSSLATNVFLDLLGNSRIVLDGVAWLAQDEQLIGLVPKSISPSAIVLTGSRRHTLIWWSIGIPVAVALGFAVFAWSLRRR
jgi:ABC-type uncharacterized transport system involved in gliding motility auxiliary subunit